MQDRYLFPFSSIITLIDPNKIGGSRSDTSTARFEYIEFKNFKLHFTIFNFRYCDNHVTEELNEVVGNLISRLVGFQRSKYRTNPIRAVANKRYAMGLRQVKKYILWNKAKLIVIAPDMEGMLLWPSFALLFGNYRIKLGASFASSFVRIIN